MDDIDFDYHSIQVWQGKGSKNRRVTLANELISALKNQISVVEKYYQYDLKQPKLNGVWLPFALAIKYPKAPKEFGWQYPFPSKSLSIDPDANLLHRHHVNETSIRKNVKQAARKAHIKKM